MIENGTGEMVEPFANQKAANIKEAPKRSEVYR